jgi:hypothetical protein
MNGHNLKVSQTRLLQHCRFPANAQGFGEPATATVIQVSLTYLLQGEARHQGLFA